MGILRTKRFTLQFLKPFLFMLIVLGPTTTPSSAADYTTLVYKGCSQQKLPDGNSDNLKTLLSSLVAESGQKGFAAITAGNAVSGAYQCRGDLSNSDCHSCVSEISGSLGRLCGGGGDVAAVRVQLSGCYLRYEAVGFKQVSQDQLLYKVCGSRKVVDGGGFEARRDAAFVMVENGVKIGGGLFYTGSYQSLYVLGQCEGNLGSDDCVSCVKSAEDVAKGQCGDSISAQVYLYSCYISYSFYPSGVPTIASSSSGGHQHTSRTVAIAVGGVAAFGFLIVCLMCLKSVLKKRSNSKY